MALPRSWAKLDFGHLWNFLIFGGASNRLLIRWEQVAAQQCVSVNLKLNNASNTAQRFCWWAIIEVNEGSSYPVTLARTD